MDLLKGKTLIVTGASRGIGKALALELARAKANLVLNARSTLLLAEVQRQCNNSAARVTSVVGDISQPIVARELVAEAVKLGNFYGFIHDAGVDRPGPFIWELPENDFQEVLGANLIGGYNLVRFSLPELLRTRAGVAVFFGSAAAEVAVPGIAAYCIAKAAEEHLARQLAAEAPWLTTFAYRPGIVDTDMQREARQAQGGAAESLHREFRGYQERGELIPPEAAAAALVKLILQDRSRLRGKTINYEDVR
jgi:NAD(P)-dependent dehydrogenase (short-subunit alcohol dehydrogenase family)